MLNIFFTNESIQPISSQNIFFSDGFSSYNKNNIDVTFHSKACPGVYEFDVVFNCWIFGGFVDFSVTSKATSKKHLSKIRSQSRMNFCCLMTLKGNLMIIRIGTEVFFFTSSFEPK